eukprot:scaffold21520_cov29-Phaeocystis_antarctica.AAC.4
MTAICASLRSSWASLRYIAAIVTTSEHVACIPYILLALDGGVQPVAARATWVVLLQLRQHAVGPALLLVLLLLDRFQCSERPLDVLLRLFSTLSSRMESCWSCEGSGSRLRLREPEAKGSRLCSTASAGKSTVSRSSEASASLASAASSCRGGLSGSSFDCARCTARLTTACSAVVSPAARRALIPTVRA